MVAYTSHQPIINFLISSDCNSFYSSHCHPSPMNQFIACKVEEYYSNKNPSWVLLAKRPNLDQVIIFYNLGLKLFLWAGLDLGFIRKVWLLTSQLLSFILKRNNSPKESYSDYFYFFRGEVKLDQEVTIMFLYKSFFLSFWFSAFTLLN